MQIALTFRNNLRNVKRRVLHTRGFAMYYITRAEVGAPLRPSCRLSCALRFKGCENNFVSAPNGRLRLLGWNADSGWRSAKVNRPAAGHRHFKDATSHRLQQLRIFHKIPVIFYGHDDNRNFLVNLLVSPKNVFFLCSHPVFNVILVRLGAITRFFSQTQQRTRIHSPLVTIRQNAMLSLNSLMRMKKVFYSWPFYGEPFLRGRTTQR